MKRFFAIVFGFMLLSGCAASAPLLVRIEKELKYKKIVVMPFTESEGANALLAQEKFLSELSLFLEIEIIGQMDETTIKNLGVSHPESFGPLDFSTTPEGDERRKKVLKNFPADTLIFGFVSVEPETVSLHIQMMESQSGAVILSFSKEASIYDDLADNATTDLAQKAAQKTIDFLKENVVITRVHRR